MTHIYSYTLIEMKQACFISYFFSLSIVRLHNAHEYSVMKAFQMMSLESQELKPRSSTTLPIMFSKNLNVDCSKIES